MTLRLLSYNIRRGGIGREQALAAVIRACGPDVVLLQEATVPSVVESLAAATGMRDWGAVPLQSLAFLSRLGIAHRAWRRPRWSKHAFLEIVPAGLDVRVFGVHLSAVHAALTERRRVYELRALVAALKREHPGVFHLVAGDFNTLAPGELLDVTRLPHRLRPFLWMTGGVIQWRTISVMLESGYVDAFRQLNPAEPGATFPTWDPHIRLDYVFVPAGYTDRLTSSRVWSEEAAVREASDHLPLLAEVEVSEAVEVVASHADNVITS
jgi:endonuclease/exonuclease/phosphatase family metal-dependent hydrolase